jgi:tyrosine-protein kinase Etk/Wzc
MSGESDWLAYLCREFDMVLLDCPAVGTSPAAAETAAMADAAVLVVEAAQTPKQRIKQAQRILDLTGVRLAGCVLMQRR